jgi:hypothetical protein
MNYMVNGGTSGWLQSSPVAPFGFQGGTVLSNFVPFCTSLTKITDGSSNTLLMAEARVFPLDQGVLPANSTGTTTSATADADNRGSPWSGVGHVAFSTFSTPNSGIDTTYGQGCRADYDPVNLPCQNASGSLNTPHAAPPHRRDKEATHGHSAPHALSFPNFPRFSEFFSESVVAPFNAVVALWACGWSASRACSARHECALAAVLT